MKAVESWSACWKPAQEHLVVADVAAQEDNVLLAVHEAPLLRRRRVPLRGQTGAPGVPATQQDLVDHFLGPAPEERTLIMPIIGAPGTGKSHLIRWLRAALPVERELVVRHIPREGTSLPRVVELLFERVEGEEFDELREKLVEFRGDLDSIDADGRLDEVATRLVYRMAQLLEFDRVPWVRAADIDPKTRTALRDAKVLPALLTDAAVRAKLVREGGAVHRIARDIVEGYQQGDDDDEELGFRASDLVELVGVRGVGPLARQAVVKLRLPGLADAAVKILTDALNQASAELVPTGGTSLNDLLQRFRRLLADQDQELVLLFEDIAIARGLQLDLVDALTTPGRRPGEPDLCVLRVALAVTNTYWEEAPETLSTRAFAWQSEMFDVDLPADEAAKRAPELVGRYFNAARIGREDLLRRGPDSLAQGVENACAECPLREPCHTTFGATAHGHGLFPLTEPAVRRLGEQADRHLRPRLVLSEVVAPALRQWDAVNDHRFPDHARWTAAVATAVELGDVDELTGVQQEALERAPLSEVDRERARTVLRAWTRPGTSGQDVLAALGVPLEIGAEPAKPPPPAVVKPVGPTSPVTPPREVVDEDARRIEAWGGGAVTLGATLARDLRGAAWRALQDGVRWPELGRSQRAVLETLDVRAGEKQQAAQVVRIDNAATGGTLTRSTADPLVVLKPSVHNARLLAALQRQGKGTATLDDLARIRTLTDQVEAEIGVRLKRSAADRARVTDELRLLTLAVSPLAAAAGIGDRPTWRTALRDLSDLPVRSAARTSAWSRLEAAALAEHAKLREAIEAVATRSQGGAGAPTAFDPTLVDERSLERDPDAVKRAPADGDLAQRREELLSAAEAAVEAEANAIREILQAIAAHVGEDERLPLKTITDEVQAAMAAAEQVHLLTPHDKVVELRAMQLPRATGAAAAVEAAAAAVRAADRGVTAEALYRLGGVDTEMLALVQQYLDAAALIIRRSSTSARAAIEQRSGSGSSARGDAVRAAAAALLSSCEVPR
jgi:hypothetical protein